MHKIFISFNADDGEDLAQLMRSVLEMRHPPSWMSEEPPPLDPQAVEDAQTLTDAEYDAKHPGPSDNGDDPPPEPSAPSPPPKKARKARAAAPPVAPPEPEPELNAPQPEVELPALEALKNTVTNAVREAQKGGSKKILELLPGFKDTTGLAYVMNAEDKHRGALYDLVLAADLSVV